MTEMVELALITAAPPTLVAVVTLAVSLSSRRQVKIIHHLMNNRLDELLTATRLLSHAQGMTDERAAAKERQE